MIEPPAPLKGLSESKQEFTVARLDEIFLSKEKVVGKTVKGNEKEFTVVKDTSSRLSSKPFAKPKINTITNEESSDDVT